MKTPLTIFSLFMTVLASGQGKADKELAKVFKNQKLDTFLLVKSGCRSCEISYEDSLKVEDTLSIFLLYKKNGILVLQNFSDTGKTINGYNLQSDIFKFITEKTNVLKQANTYYKEQKLLKFQAPCLATFPYEKLQIKIGQFQHKHTLVNRETDECGVFIKNENWFLTELEVLKKLDEIISSNL